MAGLGLAPLEDQLLRLVGLERRQSISCVGLWMRVGCLHMTRAHALK